MYQTNIKRASKISNKEKLKELVAGVPARITAEMAEDTTGFGASWLDSYRNCLSSIMLQAHTAQLEGDIDPQKAKAIIDTIVDISKRTAELKKTHGAGIPPKSVQDDLLSALTNVESLII